MKCTTVSAAILTLLAGMTTFAQKDQDRFVAKNEEGRAVGRLADSLVNTGFSGAVLAARNAEVVLATGVGPRDAEGNPNTARTLFELASATKQFTGAAICKLVEAGKLGLDDPIRKHLPDVPENCAKITVRHLLQHTSGIPGTNSRGGGHDLERIVPLFLAGGPRHDPGTHWEYWNQGYALLAGIIQQKSGKDFSTFCREELFKKAKMKTARFTGDEAPKGYPVATGLSSRGHRGALDHPYGSYGYQYLGMGGAVANVWDLWRWDRALHITRVLSEPAKKELFKPGLRDYALGWRVSRRTGRLVQSHGGSVRGFVCVIRRYPEQNGCLFVLANRDRVDIYGIADALERTLFGHTVAPIPSTLEGDLQAKLIGRYVHERGAHLVVEAEGAVTRARIEWNKNGKGPFTRALIGRSGDDELVFHEWRGSPTKVRMKRGPDGDVDQLLLGKEEYLREP